MTLRLHPLSRIVDVLVFALAVFIALTFLSCFAPVYSQVINPPPVSGGPDTNAVPRVRAGTTTNIVVISGADGGDFYNGAYVWNGSVYAKSFDTWIVRVEDHWEIQNSGTPEWGSQNFPFEWYPLTNPGYPTGEWGIGPVTNYDDTGNFYGNFVGTVNGQLPYVGIPGDMLASVWANGSADGNPNVVDHARYAWWSGSAGHANSADSAGYADSASYANNAGGWNGFGFPSGSGYLYFDGMGLSWGWPSGSGDMNRSVYDTDYNDQVDYAQSAGSAGWADSAGSVESANNATLWASHGWPTDAAGALLNDGNGNLSWTSVTGVLQGPDDINRVYLNPSYWFGFMDGPNGYWPGGMYASGTDFIVGYNPVDAPNIVFKNVDHSETPGLELNCGVGGVRVSGTPVFTANGQLTLAALAQLQGYNAGATQVLKHDDTGALFWATP